MIGAGPAGSQVAYRLASLSYKVFVFEEHQKIGEPVQCTGIIGRECVERFQVPESLILGEENSAKLFGPSGRFLRLEKDTVQAFVVDRAGFDQVLAERAQKEGAQYLLGSRVTDLQVRNDGIRVEVDHLGKIATFEGKTAVIASGVGTKLPYRLGLGQIGDYVAGAQAEVAIDGVDEVEVYFGQRIAPGFFAWLVPISQGKGLAGLFSRRSPGIYLRDLLLNLRLQGKITAEAKVSYGRIPLRPLPRTYASRVVVVGDAAGQVKPTTGGGVYYGLLCAEIAAGVLNKALATNNYSGKLFSRYEKAWKARLGRELRIGYFTRRLYEKLSDWQIETVFRIIESKGIHQALLDSPDMSFDWHRGLILRGLKYLGPWRRLFGWQKSQSLSANSFEKVKR